MSFERMRARADRIKTECDLGQLLYDYGYGVVPDRHREQQFQCDLHGVDNSPSARFYGHNNTTYCWACGKTRDPIAYVMEKELVTFRGAVEHLEKKLSLPPLPWSDEDNRPVAPVDEIAEIEAAHLQVSYEDCRENLRNFLQAMTGDRDEALDSRSLLSFWEVLDRIDYGVARQDWPESKGSKSILALKKRVMEKLKERSL